MNHSTPTPDDPPCEHCGATMAHHQALGLTSGPVCPTGSELTLSTRRNEPTSWRRRKCDMPHAGTAPSPRVPLGNYVHIKSGATYRVIGGVFDASESSEPHDEVGVLYESVVEGYLASRPVDEFLEKFVSAKRSKD